MAFSFEDTDQCRIEFCRAAGISDEDWAKADISWNVLAEIGKDHLMQSQSLSASATMYANIIQSIQGVHSVRWRVKDEVSLLAKIVRKRVAQKENYRDISVENYYQVITDLVGIRALHLLKIEIEEIHRQLNPLLEQIHPPVAYIRKGDPEEVDKTYEALGLTVEHHPHGYRSIHYVKKIKPFKRDLHVEIQVRTVFEEGWSEIDHRVRYPNLSTHELVSYASQLLNRLSGMADEMSTYAIQLTKSLSIHSKEIEASNRERDDVLERMGMLVQQIETLKDDDASKSSTIDKLKRDIVNLRQSVAQDLNLLGLTGLGAARPNFSFTVEEKIRDLINGQSSVEQALLKLQSTANPMGAFRDPK